MIISSILISITPETWGTVSDWVMIGVALLTAILLYITLKSQKDVQQTQNELFRIENIRFKESIKPVLKYTGYSENFQPAGPNKKMLTIEVNNDTNNIALNISILVSDTDITRRMISPMDITIGKNHLTKGDKPLIYHFLVDTDSPQSEFVCFSINYSDVSGTIYRQGVFCLCDNMGVVVNPFLPEVVTEDIKRS